MTQHTKGHVGHFDFRFRVVLLDPFNMLFESFWWVLGVFSSTNRISHGFKQFWGVFGLTTHPYYGFWWFWVVLISFSLVLGVSNLWVNFFSSLARFEVLLTNGLCFFPQLSNLPCLSFWKGKSGVMPALPWSSQSHSSAQLWGPTKAVCSFNFNLFSDNNESF